MRNYNGSDKQTISRRPRWMTSSFNLGKSGMMLRGRPPLSLMSKNAKILSYRSRFLRFRTSSKCLETRRSRPKDYCLKRPRTSGHKRRKLSREKIRSEGGSERYRGLRIRHPKKLRRV